MNMQKYVSNQRGRSMIEMLGVLAIVGVLSVAGIAGYSKAMAKYKTNKVMDQINSIATNVRTIFSAQGNYKGLDTKTAYNLGIYPEEMAKDCTNSSCSPKHAFGGSISLSGNGDVFNISIFNISKESCAALVTADWGSASNMSAIMGFNDKVATKYYTYAQIKASSIISISSDICVCSSTENKCGIMFYFK